MWEHRGMAASAPATRKRTEAVRPPPHAPLGAAVGLNSGAALLSLNSTADGRRESAAWGGGGVWVSGERGCAQAMPRQVRQAWPQAVARGGRGSAARCTARGSGTEELLRKTQGIPRTFPRGRRRPVRHGVHNTPRRVRARATGGAYDSESSSLLCVVGGQWCPQNPLFPTSHHAQYKHTLSP